MEGLIIVRWRRAQPGREAESLKNGDAAQRFFERLREQGRIAGFEWIASFTGSDDHMFIIRGDPQTLMALSVAPETLRLLLEGSLVNEGWHMDFAVSGASIDEVWPGWRERIAALPSPPPQPAA